MKRKRSFEKVHHVWILKTFVICEQVRQHDINIAVQFLHQPLHETERKVNLPRKIIEREIRDVLTIHNAMCLVPRTCATNGNRQHHIYLHVLLMITDTGRQAHQEKKTNEGNCYIVKQSVTTSPSQWDSYTDTKAMDKQNYSHAEGCHGAVAKTHVLLTFFVCLLPYIVHSDDVTFGRLFPNCERLAEGVCFCFFVIPFVLFDRCCRLLHAKLIPLFLAVFFTRQHGELM